MAEQKRKILMLIDEVCRKINEAKKKTKYNNCMYIICNAFLFTLGRKMKLMNWKKLKCMSVE